MMPTKSPKILIIDDDDEIRYSLKRVLSARGYDLVEAASGEEGIEVAAREEPDFIFLDNRMGGMTGIEALQHIRARDENARVILMTAYGTAQSAIEAMKFGAYDYIVKPFDLRKIIELTESVLSAKRSQEKVPDYEPLLDSEDYKEGIVGSSEAMRSVLKQIGQYAAKDLTVLITGESGTGKELIARCLHQHSLRSRKPFIAINCAAIPDNLIESELFGHEKGAFTGATGQRKGKFELCDQGTIFLDEIGDMAPATQTKILRVLQEGELQRVGGTETIQVNIRMIAATNKNLESMVEDASFREDLYYRLNVARIRMPALRERLEDLPELIDYMLQRMVKERKTRISRISPEALKCLQEYHWQGNVRELENVIYRAAVVANGNAILTEDLPLEIRDPRAKKPEVPPAGEATETPEPPSPPAAEAPPAPAENETGQVIQTLYQLLRKEGTEGILQELESHLIRLAMEETSGNQLKASQILGMTRTTLRKRLQQN